MRIGLILALAIFLFPITPVFGWSHQGHILITRLAALRIINDQNAPKGLRDFLATNMNHSLADCQEFATTITVGGDMSTSPYNEGLSKWATMPDQVRTTPEGLKPIAPYGMPEASMHALDMEAFSPVFAYKDDLSNKPDVDAISHDVTDPRWKRGGFVPWRVEEFYHKLADAIGPGETVAHPDDALHAAGYLAHYTEDSTQPHHSTIDYHSVSYLIGHVPGMPASTAPSVEILATMRAPKGIDPHGDIEYRLFDDAQPPRGEFRKEYWKDLMADIDALATERSKQPAATAAANFDSFRYDLHVLSDGYDYLPFVGHAAQVAYTSGKFDPAAFFGFEGITHGQQMTMIQLIALQNAKAVLNVEMEYRLAWDLTHSPGH